MSKVCSAGVRGGTVAVPGGADEIRVVGQHLPESTLTEKVPCSKCGVMILPSTVKRTGGLCMPCSRGNEYTFCRDCGKRIFKAPSVAEYSNLCLTCVGNRERQRPTAIEAFVEQHGGGDCSLITSLFQLDERLRRERRDDWIGLNLIDPPEQYDSDVTPKNAIAFAETGGDAVHFSLVTARGRVNDSSPVVMTVPRAGGTVWDRNFLVGESLYEFLCLGCTSGFSPLENLAYFWQQAVTEIVHGSEPDEFDEQQARTLRLYRDKLSLSPWATVEERLQELERSKKFVLKFRRFRIPWRR